MNISLGSIFVRAVLIMLLSSVQSRAMQSTEHSASLTNKDVQTNHIPTYISEDGTADHTERLLTHLRTTFGFHHAELDDLPAPKAGADEGLIIRSLTAPSDAPHYLNLGAVRRSASNPTRGLALAAPLTVPESWKRLKRKAFRAFAVFSVFAEPGRPGTGAPSQPYTMFHGYVYTRNVADFERRIGRSIREENRPLVPGELVSWNDIWREVQQGSHIA